MEKKLNKETQRFMAAVISHLDITQILGLARILGIKVIIDKDHFMEFEDLIGQIALNFAAQRRSRRRELLQVVEAVNNNESSN